MDHITQILNELKCAMLLSLLGDGAQIQPIKDFITALVENGCPVEAIIEAFQRVANKEADYEKH